MRRARRKPQAARSVHYEIDMQARGRCLTDEGAIERVLAAHPDVIGFDTGRGWLVWWNVRPGAAARELRRQLEELCMTH